jgi:2-polyprenyl-3-methyl-5-hydroxy-6-metoxy-1,4-benzoquinol methylase
MEFGSYRATRERFDDRAAADDYVIKKNLTDNARNRRELACIERALEGLAPGARVLDLPCGSGRLEPVLARRGFEVTAADYSEPMLAAARRHTESAAARVRFRREDILSTTFADAEFDAVICNRLLHHYPEAELRRAVLAELARICRGRLVVSFYWNLALSALRFHLRNRIKGIRPNDRIPITLREFRADFESCGLVATGIFPVRRGISPQTYVRLERR